MSPGNSASVNPSLSQRQFRPVISQAYLANLFGEANDTFFHAEYGMNMYYYAYCRARKVWHKCCETGGYLDQGCGCWMVDQYGAPLDDFKPGVYFDLRCLLAPLRTANTASESSLRNDR